jgi:IPT/TIG domain/Bacterial TSP3 repeat
MSRRTLLALLALAASLLAVTPAWAKSAKSHKSSTPTIKSIHPLSANIGQKLTIRGTGFVRGKKKNTVVFMGAGKRVVWVKADTATTKKITVKLPDTLAAILTNSGGSLVATKLQVRVIAKKSARAFTKLSKSPKIGPKNSSATAPTSCVPHPTVAGSDVDGDMLPDALELSFPHPTDPCKYDTDGDGISDGYEYQAALDLNRTGNASPGNIPWPYPGKRPYPNPLDPSDADIDFDGDVLTLKEEYTGSFAWKLGIDPGHVLQTFLPYAPNPNPQNNVMVVAYSDGDQTTNPQPSGNLVADPTGPPAPCPPSATTDQSGYDVNGNGSVGDSGDVLSYQSTALGGYVGTSTPLGWMNQDGCFLSDDEKDIDGDGLSNYTEAHGPLMGQSWWTTFVPKAGIFPVSYAATDWLDRDTDGDGIPDGADDQDHDGYTNIQESRPLGDPKDDVNQARSVWAWVDANEPSGVSIPHPNIQAFNPCLPNVLSPTCPRHPPGAAGYAPFADQSPSQSWADPDAP